MPKSKESQEFLERKTLIEMQTDLEKYKHRIAMQELEFRRESDRQHHERELERSRIKTAEIHKTLAFRNRSYNE